MFFLFLHVQIFCLHVCIYTMCVPGAHIGSCGTGVVLSHRVSAANQTWVICKNKVFLATEPSSATWEEGFVLSIFWLVLLMVPHTGSSTFAALPFFLCLSWKTLLRLVEWWFWETPGLDQAHPAYFLYVVRPPISLHPLVFSSFLRFDLKPALPKSTLKPCSFVPAITSHLVQSFVVSHAGG